MSARGRLQYAVRVGRGAHALMINDWGRCLHVADL